MGRSGYHHGDLKQALIAGSIELISEEGVEALTLRRLAARVGVSHAAPQHHFANKEALLLAVAEQGFIDLTRALHEAAGGEADRFEQLRAAGMAYVKFAADHPAHFRVMFGPHIAKNKGITGPSNAALLDAARLVAIEIGNEDLAKTISLAAWSMVHGLATLWLDGALSISKRQLQNRAAEVTAFVADAIRG